MTNKDQIIAYLKKNGPSSVTSIVEGTRITQPHVSKILAENQALFAKELGIHAIFNNRQVASPATVKSLLNWNIWFGIKTLNTYYKDLIRYDQDKAEFLALSRLNDFVGRIHDRLIQLMDERNINPEQRGGND